MGGVDADRIRGAKGRLAINSNELNGYGVFQPTISGFAAGDSINFTEDSGAPITSVQYSGGQLKLYAGARVVSTLNLSGMYNNYFSVVPLNGGSTY